MYLFFIPIVRANRLVFKDSAAMWDTDSKCACKRLCARRWRNANQQHQPRIARVGYAMLNASWRPDHHAGFSLARLSANDKHTLAFDDKIELILICMDMRVLYLARLQAVEAKE
jgi:hypothetical protein